MTSMTSRSAALCLVTLAASTLAACGDSTSGNGGEGGSAASTKSSSSAATSTKSASVSATSSDVSASSSSTGVPGPCGDDTNLPEEDLGTGPDPEAGMFTLDEALAGLPEGPGPLRAILTTDLGVLTCALFPEVAPNGVANFVGLARGRRPFKEAGKWIRGRRFYDGLIFHRVIDDFMAQGGDPLGTGFGGPGYSFMNEIGAETHSPGTLSYANSGNASSNGSQFYIVAETGADFLDGNYTIFGRCTPVDTVKAMTEVETAPDDKPLVDVHLQTVDITRCAE